MAQMAALANGQLTEIHPTVSVSQPGGLSRKEGASLPAGLGRCLLPTCWQGPGRSTGLRPARRPGQPPDCVLIREGRWACWLHTARTRPLFKRRSTLGLKHVKSSHFKSRPSTRISTQHRPHPTPAAQVCLRKQHRKGHLWAGRLRPRADAGPSVRGVSSRVLAGYVSSIVVTEQLCKPFLCWRCLLL